MVLSFWSFWTFFSQLLLRSACLIHLSRWVKGISSRSSSILSRRSYELTCFLVVTLHTQRIITRPFRCRSDEVPVQVPLAWRCKLFLCRWWEITGRLGCAYWICPMRHGVLWWHQGRKHHPRTSSPQGSRRMAPSQSSLSPLWPLSLVIYRYGQFTRLHPDVGSGFSVPEITLHLLWTQLEQATQKLNFVLTPKRHQVQGCLSDFWSISGPVQQYQYSAIWLSYP